MKKRIDITGDVCPMTFVRVKMAMEEIAEGESLEVILNKDDVSSVLSSVKTEGYHIVEAKDDGEHFRVIIKK